MSIQFIEAEGNNYEIGFIIGKKLKNKLRKLLEIDEKNYKRKSGKSLSEHAKRLKQLVIKSKRYFPQYLEEVKGMSEGSGIDFNYIFALGCEDDLVYNCTSIAGRSKEGILIVHNEDWLRDHLNYLYICKIKQKNKPASICLSYIGHLPGFATGLNSERFAYTGNSLHFQTNKNGVPLQFFQRAFLDTKKYSDVIKLASMKNRMIGSNSLMVFKNKIFDLELMPKGYAIISGKRYLAHTNHVLNKKIISKEKRHSKDSIWILKRANELLTNNEITFNLFKKVLSDHKYGPPSICCHEKRKRGNVPYATIASVIANVSKGKFFVAHGNPCKSKYKEYKL